MDNQIASDQVSIKSSRDDGSGQTERADWDSITLSGMDNIRWKLTRETDTVLLSFILREYLPWMSVQLPDAFLYLRVNGTFC